jgi:response regulator RpfG family c-di-GMP phosphodiesterase
MTQEKDKILICDDEEDIRQLLRKILEGEGYDCREAASAGAALKSMDTAIPALVLLDLSLPDKSGVELLQEVKKRYSDIPVIIVSVVDELNTAIHCIRLGAYDYSPKPINADEILNCVRRALQMRKLQAELQDYRCHLEEKVEEQAAEIRRTFLGAMSALSFALEARDAYTAGHSRRVADIALAIGKKYGLSEDELEDLRWGSLLHDLAKITLDEKILNKGGKLTAKEYAHVMTHPIVGACMTGSFIRKKSILNVIEHHHEHYNGHGLGQTLVGEEIPLLARIVAVADAYDAMTSDRPYRTALTREQALAQIKAGLGQQFDPGLGKVFLGLSEIDITPERRKILIADDDESIRLLVRSIFGNDFLVVEAVDGQQAIELALSEKPTLIMMDIMMPVKDGLLACYEIKTNRETEDIPVVMLTGINQELNKKFSSNVGASKYITKPFIPQELYETVRKMCGGE